MPKPRNHYKYQYKIGNKIVHGGITKDLERREQEHQQKWPKGHIKQVGRKTTEGRCKEMGKRKRLYLKSLFLKNFFIPDSYCQMPFF